MTDSIAKSRRWLFVAVVGAALVVIAMVVVALVIVDKENFGGLVGASFLQIITSGVLVGSVVLLVGGWNLPQRKTWRGYVLLVWGLIALTSPLFGIMFLLPWGLLVLALPLIVTIFVAFFRGTPAT